VKACGAPQRQRFNVTIPMVWVTGRRRPELNAPIHERKRNTFRKGRLDGLSIHPTVKPVALVADAIKDCSRRGNIVLDPFMGSGTTILAAEKVGRRA
jgi:DNA modification methylase